LDYAKNRKQQCSEKVFYLSLMSFKDNMPDNLVIIVLFGDIKDFPDYIFFFIIYTLF